MVIHVVVNELYDLSHWLKDLERDPAEAVIPGVLPAPEMRLKSRDFH